MGLMQARWAYDDGSPVDYSMSIAQRPWGFGSRALGGSDRSAAGVPAAFEVRRDHLLHLVLRFPASEWDDVERLARHLQGTGSATLYTNQDEVRGFLTHTVYGDAPAIEEELRPRRSDEPSTLELQLTVRRTTDEVFTDPYYFEKVFDKPSIASPEMEYDMREETEADLATVDPWDDQTANGNDADPDGSTPKMLTQGWDLTTPAVRLLGSVSDHFIYDGTVFENKPVTLFSVIEATDISDHLALWGSSFSSTPPRFVSHFIRSDGSVIFTYGSDPYDLRTPAGLIVAGGRYIITARQSNVTGMIIKINGVLAGSSPGITSPVVTNTTAHLGLVRDTITGGIGQKFGVDKLFAWFSGYSSAASDDELVAMERHLGQQFGIEIP